MAEDSPAPTAGAEAPTTRTKVRRLAERGRYDRAAVDAILDEGFVCHVGWAGEHGPVVIPTAYGRIGDHLYLHGAPANATLRHARAGRTRLRDGDAGRRAGPGPFGVPPLDQLPVGGDLRDRNRGDRRRGEASRAGRGGRAHRARPGRRRPATDRLRAAGHPGGPGPARRGIGQGPHRRSEGRSRRPRPAHLGGPGPAPDRPGRTRRRRRATRLRSPPPGTWSTTPVPPSCRSGDIAPVG